MTFECVASFLIPIFSGDIVQSILPSEAWKSFMSFLSLLKVYQYDKNGSTNRRQRFVCISNRRSNGVQLRHLRKNKSIDHCGSFFSTKSAANWSYIYTDISTYHLQWSGNDCLLNGIYGKSEELIAKRFHLITS